jgi:Uma2 family endonuclease
VADTARQMTADEFLEWCLAPEREEQKWEFVDGFPVELMTGTTDDHDQIVVNLIAALVPRLRGGPCAPRTADQAIKTMKERRVRRADVVVDCGPRAPKGLHSKTPTVVIEVLSPSTVNVTRSIKLDEYKGLETAKHVVLLDQDSARVWLHSRAANDAWTAMEIEGLDALLPLPGIGVDLPMAEIYADVAFGGADAG